MLNQKKIVLSVIVFLFIACTACTKNNSTLLFSNYIDSYDMKISAYSDYDRSGNFIYIEAKFKGVDSFYEYCLYSLPFGSGPVVDVPPVKKVSSQVGPMQYDSYYTLIKPADSLYNDSECQSITRKDELVIGVFDSLIHLQNESFSRYRKYHHDLKQYQKQKFSLTDLGLFIRKR